MFWKGLFSSVFIAFFSLNGTGLPGELIGVTWDDTGVPTMSVSIDISTGNATAIGTTSFSHLNSLAIDSQGILHSVATTPGGEAQMLVKIDPVTGAMTGLLAVDTFLDIRALAFASDDTLFAIHDTGVTPESPVDLYTLDTATGEEFLIGRPGFVKIQALSFSPDGMLYGWDLDEGLLVLDPVSGEASDVNLSVSGTVDIQSITFLSDGSLLGGRDELYLIDPATGVVSFVGVTGFDIRGIERNPVVVFVDGFESADTSRWSSP